MSDRPPTTAATGCLSDLAMDAYQAIPQPSWMTPGMTNFDGTVDDGCEEVLATGAATQHAAQEFNGLVVLRDGIYVEWVRRYHSVVCRHTASSLKELMEDVNNAHGWE